MSNLISITFLLKCHVCHLRVFIHQNILSDLILQKYPKAFLFNDARVKSLKPRCACTRVVLWLNDPPQYEHKSGMIIPRYANTWEDCGSATHGTIRRHHSWGLLTPTSYNRIFLFYQNYNTRFSICQYLCTKNMADQPGIFFLQQNFPHFVNYPLSKANGLPASQTSQPTISTGVNSGSPCPILLFLCYLS